MFLKYNFLISIYYVALVEKKIDTCILCFLILLITKFKLLH